MKKKDEGIRMAVYYSEVNMQLETIANQLHTNKVYSNIKVDKMLLPK